MQIQSQELKYQFKRSVCIGLAFLFVVIGAGCATAPPPEQGHIKVQNGQGGSAEVYWPK